ncbi:MAG: cache domain-containing protein [Rhodospirillaceae bacterium]
MTTRRFSLAVALVIVGASGTAATEPCQSNTEAVKNAVTVVAKTLDDHGIKYVRDSLYNNGDGTICGIGFVSIIDYSGTWVASLLEPGNVGKNIRSFNDGAAINFFNGMIHGAIERKGNLVSYFTKDTQRGAVIDKSLYFIDVPSRKLVVYGAFASK